MKKILLLILIILFSCDEENVTNVKEKDKEGNNTLNFFKVPYELYPEYTFWGHGFKLTIDLDDTLDITKLKYFFNGYEINAYEVNKTETQYIQLFEMPLDAFSDSLEIRQYIGDDSLIFFTRKYDVVNSEIEIDSVNFPLCYNNSTISGKGMKYAKYLKLVSQHNYGGGFNESYFYNNNAKGFSGSSGITIDENIAKYNFPDALSYAFKIEAYDSIKTVRHPYPQLHSYPYIYYSKGTAYIENPIIRRIFVKGKIVEIETDRWSVLKDNDIIKINGKVVKNDNISFRRSSQSWYAGFLDPIYGSLTLELEKGLENNKLEIDFECGNDTTLFFELGTEYKSALIFANLGIGYFKVDEKSKTGNDFSDYININEDELKSNFNYPIDYVKTASESRNGYSSNHLKKLDLTYLKDDSIKFNYIDNFRSYNSSNYQGESYDNFNIDYEGPCQIDDLGATISVRINRSQLTNMKISRNLYSSVEHFGSVTNKYVVNLDYIDFDADAFIEFVFVKW